MTHLAAGICNQCWSEYVHLLDWCELALKKSKRMFDLFRPISVEMVCLDKKLLIEDRNIYQSNEYVDVYKCYNNEGYLLGIVLNCNKFMSFVWQQKRNNMTFPLLRSNDGSNCCIMMDEVNAYRNSEFDGLCWYKDSVNKGIPFTIGLAKQWNNRGEKFTLYENESLTKILCTGLLEFYELNGKARTILHFVAAENVEVSSMLLQKICVFINDHAIDEDRLAYVKKKLHALDKIKFDAIQISIGDPGKKELRCFCWHCGKPLRKRNGNKRRKKKQKCRGCGIAFYCSRGCQKKDWILHRKLCKKKRLVVKDSSNRKYMHDWC